jgi:hypothetical protein
MQKPIDKNVKINSLETSKVSSAIKVNDSLAKEAKTIIDEKVNAVEKILTALKIGIVEVCLKNVFKNGEKIEINIFSLLFHVAKCEGFSFECFGGKSNLKRSDFPNNPNGKKLFKNDVDVLYKKFMVFNVDVLGGYVSQCSHVGLCFFTLKQGEQYLEKGEKTKRHNEVKTSEGEKQNVEKQETKTETKQETK